MLEASTLTSMQRAVKCLAHNINECFMQRPRGSPVASRGSMAGPVPKPAAPSIRWPMAQSTSITSATGWLRHTARTKAAM